MEELRQLIQESDELQNAIDESARIGDLEEAARLQYECNLSKVGADKILKSTTDVLNLENIWN